MADFSHLRVLVADDTSDIRDLLSLYLTRSEVEVLLAENGRQAVDTALAQLPDLVLMDMEMPVMNGLDATRSLRTQGYRGAILALSAHQDPEQARLMSEAGCDGVLGKPLSRRRLLEVLADMSGSNMNRDN